MAAFVVKRRNLRGDTPCDVSADGAGEDNDLALVTLNVFEVLDEDRLGRFRLLPKALKRRIGGPLSVEKVLDELLLLAIERDDADRVCGRFEASDDFRDDGRGLGAIDASLAALVDAVLDRNEAHRRVLRER